VTYADLASYSGGGKDEDPVILDWLAVLRALRDACMDPRQPDPMLPKDFAEFNQVLNLAARGGRRWAERMPSSEVDSGDSFHMDADRHAEARMGEIFQTFLRTLRSRARTRRRSRLLAIDHAEGIIENDFQAVLSPLLLRSVQENDDEFPLRVLMVTPQNWPGFRHLKMLMDSAPVVLTDLPGHEYRRLRREFWARQVHAGRVPADVTFSSFEEVLDAMYRGGSDFFTVGVYQRVLDLLLRMDGTTRSP
ncbi:hypothetical protein, partial [Streptomyces sp. KL109B]